MRSRPTAWHWTLLFAQAGIAMGYGYVIRPVISAEILDAGHSSAWLGVVTMVFAIPPLLLAIPAGRLIDRTGERPWLVWGSIAYAGAPALVLLALWLSAPERGGETGAGALAALIGSSAMLGLGSLGSMLGQQTWVMQASAGSRPDYWFGMFTFALTIGQLIAPTVLLMPGAGAGQTLATAPIAWTLLGVAGLMTIMGFGVPSLGGTPRDRGVRRGDRGDGRRDDPSIRPGVAGDSDAGRDGNGDAHVDAARDPNPSPESTMSATARLFRQRGVTRAIIASALTLASVDVLVAYLPLLTQERSLDASWIAWLLMARATAAMGSRLFLARLTAALGRRRVMVWGSAIAAAALLLAALPVPAWTLILCMGLYGFAAGTVQPLTMSWLTVITPPGDRGLVTSLRLMGNRAGQTLVPLAIAAVSVVGGGALAFAVTGVTLAASAVASMTAPNGDGRR